MRDTAILVNVKVVPGASRNRVAGRYGDGVKVQVSAAPEKGKANASVGEVLADFFSIPPRQVELVRGHGNPRKQFRLSGLARAEFDAKLASL